MQNQEVGAASSEERRRLDGNLLRTGQGDAAIIRRSAHRISGPTTGAGLEIPAGGKFQMWRADLAKLAGPV
jgi:hypothetical protein